MKDCNYSLKIMKEELENKYISPEIKYAFKTSIEAIEKQLPKAITFDRNGKNQCPNCEAYIHTDVKYCYYCGQRVFIDLNAD